MDLFNLEFRIRYNFCGRRTHRHGSNSYIRAALIIETRFKVGPIRILHLIKAAEMHMFSISDCNLKVHLCGRPSTHLHIYSRIYYLFRWPERAQVLQIEWARIIIKYSPVGVGRGDRPRPELAEQGRDGRPAHLRQSCDALRRDVRRPGAATPAERERRRGGRGRGDPLAPLHVRAAGKGGWVKIQEAITEIKLECSGRFGARFGEILFKCSAGWWCWIGYLGELPCCPGFMK